MMATVFITGANRGIGLEFAQQYLADGCKVIATCRTPENASELTKLKENFDDQLVIHSLDVTDQNQIVALSSQLNGEKIDLLINNAGVMGGRGVKLGSIEPDNFKQLFSVNALAPLMVVDALLPLLRASQQKRIVNITSRMGSIGDADAPRSFSYRASKAALNMLTKCISLQLAEEDFTVLALHPGWVKTDMGGEDALLTTEESVSNMRALIKSSTPADNGKFFHCEGYELPW